MSLFRNLPPMFEVRIAPNSFTWLCRLCFTVTCGF